VSREAHAGFCERRRVRLPPPTLLLIVSSKPVTERLRARLAEHLGELGLTLSPDKTRVTCAAEGFDFLAATRGRMVRAGSLNGGSSVMTA
jgi:hypothetical protein